VNFCKVPQKTSLSCDTGASVIAPSYKLGTLSAVLPFPMNISPPECETELLSTCMEIALAENRTYFIVNSVRIPSAHILTALFPKSKLPPRRDHFNPTSLISYPHRSSHIRPYPNEPPSNRRFSSNGHFPNSTMTVELTPSVPVFPSSLNL
jgi:hypothetical protein